MKHLIFLTVLFLFLGCGGGDTSSNSFGSPLASFTTLDDEIRLREGQSKALELQGVYHDGSEGTLINSEATYRIMDTNIASVDSDGVVTALKEGNTTIRVSYPKLNSVVLNIFITKELNTSNLNQPIFGNTYISYIPNDATLENYDEYLFAMITGKIVDDKGVPLSNVTVRIKGYKEYGSVKTDENGTYAIPVEGGKNLTVRYSKRPFVTIDRESYIKPQDWTIIPDVTLLKRDGKFTKIDLNNSHPRIHSSTKISDERGERATTLVFEGKNKVTAVDSVGNERELNTINIRATEFETPESMPAALPNTTAFTYCADITVDGTKDGEEVIFDEPIAMYVDNFLGFDLGETVPVGFYDRNKGEWVGSENGVVVRLLDTDGDGQIDALDSTGDGMPNDLNNNGNFTDEVSGIQNDSEYQAGKTYWRVMITHLTPWDCNWPYAPDGNVTPPNSNNTRGGGEDNQTGNCQNNIGSYVNTKTRDMHDDIAIAGTTSKLHYSSKRTKGYSYIIETTIDTNDLPSTAAGAEAILQIGGKSFLKQLEPNKINTIEFEWDGKDALGNPMSGAVEGKIITRYKYKLLYVYACDVPLHRSVSSVPSRPRRDISYDFIGGDGGRVCNDALTPAEAEIAWAQVGERYTGVYGSDDGIYYDVEKNITVQTEERLPIKANLANGWSFHDDLYMSFHPNGYIGNAVDKKYIEVKNNLLFAVDEQPKNRFSLPKFELDRYYAWGIGYNNVCSGNRNRNIIALEFNLFNNIVSNTTSRQLGCFSDFGGYDLYSISHLEPYDLLAYYRGTNFDGLPEWYIDASVTPWGLKKKVKERVDNAKESVLFNWNNTDNYNASAYASWQTDNDGMLWASRIVPNAAFYQQLDRLYPDYNQNLYANPFYQDIGINVNDIVVFNGFLGYVFDASTQLLTKIFDNSRKQIIRTYAYDTALRLISVTDQFGNSITVQRDYEGRPVSIKAPNGQITRLYVNHKGDLTSVTYEDGSSYQFGYNDKSLLTSKQTPNGHYASYYYNDKGRIVKESDTNNAEWQFTKSMNGNSVEYSVIRPEGDSIVYTDTKVYDNMLHSLIKLPSKDTYSFTSNGDNSDTNLSRGNVLTRTQTSKDPLTLNTVLKSQTVTLPSGITQSIEQSISYSGDISNLQSKTYVLTVNSKPYTIRDDYVSGTQTITTPLNRKTELSYDKATGLAKSIKVGNFNPTLFSYDSKGRVTQQSVGTSKVSYSYNSKGNIESITDQRGLTTWYDYDILDRVTSVTFPNGNTEYYEYDKEGNVLKYTTPKSTKFGFTFNPLSQRLSLTSPLSKATYYAYNKNRDITSVTFPSGKKREFFYENSRLNSIVTSESRYDYTYWYDNQIKSIVKDSEKTSYTYDGNLLTKISYEGSLNTDISFTYNNDFLPLSVTYAGLTDTFTYDKDNLLSGSNSFSIQRDTASGLISLVSDNTFTKSYQYDSFGYISGISDNSYEEIILSRYANNNIKSIQEGSNIYSYEYDNINRLSKVTKNNQITEEYIYDEQGNRIQSFINGNTIQASYNSDDELISYGTNSYSYDKDGYLKTKTDNEGTTQYTYTTSGELKEVILPDNTKISYIYNANNQRVSKLINGQIIEKYLWLNLTTLLAVYDKDDNLIYRYYYYPDERVPYKVKTKDDEIYYLSYNHLGSLKAVTDKNAQTIKSITYSAYGEILTDTNPNLDLKLGFAGGLYDKDTKLIRFGYRDYDPNTGRWTAKDPIDFNGGDSNLYGYVVGDPINGIDPMGLWWEYSQSTGTMTHYGTAGIGITYGTGYSGTNHGGQNGLNNPNAQSIHHTGPIPQGIWTIGTPRNSPNTGRYILPLTPASIRTQTFGRDNFQLHGDNRRRDNSASEGCIVIDPYTRRQIGGSGDNIMMVVP